MSRGIYHKMHLAIPFSYSWITIKNDIYIKINPICSQPTSLREIWMIISVTYPSPDTSPSSPSLTLLLWTLPLSKASICNPLDWHAKIVKAPWLYPYGHLRTHLERSLCVRRTSSFSSTMQHERYGHTRQDLIFQYLRTMEENQTDQNLKWLWSDNGGE